MTDTTAQSDREALARQLIESIWNEGDLETIDEIIAEDYVDYYAGEPKHRGREGLREYVTGTRETFPDFEKSIEDVVEDGDEVAIRYTATGTHENEYRGIEGTGTEVSFDGILFIHTRDGEITATYENADILGVMEQLDAV